MHTFSDFFRRAHPSRSVPIVQSDTVDHNIKLLFIAVGGDLCLQLKYDDDAQPTAITVADGTWISLPITRVWSTNTTVLDANMMGYT